MLSDILAILSQVIEIKKGCMKCLMQPFVKNNYEYDLSGESYEPRVGFLFQKLLQFEACFVQL